MILKKSITWLLICSALFLAGCGNNDKSNETKQYISQVRSLTQANEQPEKADLSALQSPLAIDLKAIKKRNPFDAEAVVSTKSGSVKLFGNMMLIGVFHINKKKWAIIRAGGKIYRVVAGDKIGPTQTIKQITDNSVTIIREDDEDRQTFTLTLQEQKQ